MRKKRGWSSIKSEPTTLVGKPTDGKVIEYDRIRAVDMFGKTHLLPVTEHLIIRIALSVIESKPQFVFVLWVETLHGRQ